MNMNVGSIDRALRIIAGIAGIAAGVYFESWWGAVALVPLLTGLIRWCPAYTVFGISTRGAECSSACCKTGSKA